jgi:hypothetical protein
MFPLEPTKLTIPWNHPGLRLSRMLKTTNFSYLLPLPASSSLLSTSTTTSITTSPSLPQSSRKATTQLWISPLPPLPWKSRRSQASRTTHPARSASLLLSTRSSTGDAVRQQASYPSVAVTAGRSQTSTSSSTSTPGLQWPPSTKRHRLPLSPCSLVPNALSVFRPTTSTGRHRRELKTSRTASTETIRCGRTGRTGERVVSGVGCQGLGLWITVWFKAS